MTPHPRGDLAHFPDPPAHPPIQWRTLSFSLGQWSQAGGQILPKVLNQKSPGDHHPSLPQILRSTLSSSRTNMGGRVLPTELSKGSRVRLLYLELILSSSDASSPPTPQTFNCCLLSLAGGCLLLAIVPSPCSSKLFLIMDTFSHGWSDPFYIPCTHFLNLDLIF